ARKRHPLRSRRRRLLSLGFHERRPRPAAGAVRGRIPRVRHGLLRSRRGALPQPPPEAIRSGLGPQAHDVDSSAHLFRDHHWQRLVLRVEPPPRMNSRLVTDPKNGVLVLFGGDGQSHYLADTWRYDLRTRAWSQSKSGTAPEARAGHFTVYDPENGWVIVGGGHNRRDLTDMWAYDAGRDRWQRLAGDVPVGFYLSADLDPERRLIVLIRLPDRWSAHRHLPFAGGTPRADCEACSG